MKTATRPSAGIQRFHAAQNTIYRQALAEITRGDKKTHWMWFIFPQHVGLARSDIARRFGIVDKAEAVAYLNNTVLRTRLYQCTMGVLSHDKLMFSRPDDAKLRSCMTLFREAAPDPTLPNKVLEKFFDGKPDPLTLDLLAGKTIKLPHTPKLKEPVRWSQPMLRVPADTEPWTRERVTSFVKSFGLSTVATRQMVEAWMADRGKAMGAIWAAREESAWRER